MGLQVRWNVIQSFALRYFDLVEQAGGPELVHEFCYALLSPLTVRNSLDALVLLFVSAKSSGADSCT